MINVCKKYKKDLYALITLGILLVVYCLVFWGRFGDIIIDCPREIYLPQRIAEGKKLYTELFSLYPPAGYYLNAFFVKIFGSSLNIFYLIGCINTGIILTLIYLISRLFSKELLSFSISLLVLCCCCISYSPPTNYFFPYSYSSIYALTCFLACVLALIKYFKTDFKSYGILLSCLLGGFAAAFKTEFIFVFIPIVIVLFIKEKSVSKKFSGILLLILPVILPFLANLDGLKIFTDNFLRFCTSPSSKEFLRTLSIKTPKEYIFSTFRDIFFFIILFIPLFYTLKKSSTLSKIKQIGLIILCLAFAYLLTHYIYQNRIYIFSWLTLSALYFFIKYWFSAKNDTDFLNIILGIILLLSSSRVGGYLASNHYGKYFLPLFFVIFFCVYLPTIIKKYNLNYEKNISIILIIFSLYSVYFFGQAVYEGKNYRINTDKGRLYATFPVGKTVEETSAYIIRNSDINDRVLVLPEGLIVNYLSGRPSDDLYYQLLPNHIEILGEDKIVQNISQNTPEFVVLSSLSTAAYGKQYFCADYAEKICDYINNNYKYLETFENKEQNRQFMMMIFGLKK